MPLAKSCMVWASNLGVSWKGSNNSGSGVYKELFESSESGVSVVLKQCGQRSARMPLGMMKRQSQEEQSIISRGIPQADWRLFIVAFDVSDWIVPSMLKPSRIVQTLRFIQNYKTYDKTNNEQYESKYPNTDPDACKRDRYQTNQAEQDARR